MVDEGDLDYAPDVLILPSRLKQFSKVCQMSLAKVIDLEFPVGGSLDNNDQSVFPQQRDLRSFVSCSSLGWYSKGSVEGWDCQSGDSQIRACEDGSCCSSWTDDIIMKHLMHLGLFILLFFVCLLIYKDIFQTFSHNVVQPFPYEHNLAGIGYTHALCNLHFRNLIHTPHAL